MRSPHPRQPFRISDAEITLPHNPPLAGDVPAPQWHVHLELGPEELMALHRLGLASGALAWREGMHDWEPLPADEKNTQQGETEDVGDSGPRDRRHGAQWNHRPQSDLGGRVSSFDRSRRHTPPLAAPLAVPVLELVTEPMPARLPPPPNPPHFEQLPSFQDYSSPSAALARVPLEQQPQPPSIPPPVAFEVRSRAGKGGNSRAIWLGAGALVALSASNGALVSALLWSLRHDGAKRNTAVPAAVASQTACPAPLTPPNNLSPTGANAPTTTDSTERPVAPVSIDQLPLMHAKSADTASTNAGFAASHAHGSTRNASSRKASLSTLASAPLRAGSTDESAPGMDREARGADSSPGAPDRQAMAQAVGRAAGAASSCSAGPEHGRVSITFASSGSVQSVQLLQGFGDADTNSCVLRAMGRAHVPPFSGPPVTVKKGLNW